MSLIKNALEELKEQSRIVSENYGGARLRWMADMLWSVPRYGARPIDYVRFEYYKKRGKERSRYLTLYKYFGLVRKLKKENERNIREGKGKLISGDKREEYELYHKFISRKWIYADKTTDKEEIRDFITKYKNVIAKPNNGEQGHGILKITDNDSLDSLLESIKKTPFILEETLVNHPELEKINLDSLNTVRIFTLIDRNGKLKVLTAIMRVGRKGSHVDNWGSGGVAYEIEPTLGIITRAGVDKTNKKHIIHPGSDIIMVGFKIPLFKELLQMVEEMAFIAPQHRFVGWDIAITPKGLELIEMNCPGGHDILQAFGDPLGDILKENW